MRSVVGVASSGNFGDFVIFCLTGGGGGGLRSSVLAVSFAPFLKWIILDYIPQGATIRVSTAPEESISGSALMEENRRAGVC